MFELEEKTEAYIRKHFLLAPGEHVICALSGGCDSVCLLLAISQLSERLGLRGVSAIHVHHGIRGKEADRDEAFCRALCERLGIPLEVRHEDVPAFAAQNGESLEEAGRKRRLVLFGKAARALSGAKVAAAHHLDDQAETVLMNLIRGSGPAGLAAMRPLREDENGFVLIRPLLWASRKEIEAYVRARGEGWCEDSTNDSGENTRSRLRQEIMPALEKIRPGAARHIAGLAEKQAAQEAFLAEEAESAFRSVSLPDGSLDAERLAAAGPVLRQRVLSLWLAENGGLKDVGEVHFAALEDLLGGQSGRKTDLPGGRCVQREQRKIRLKGRDCGDKAAGTPDRNAETALSEDFAARIFPAEENADGEAAYPKKKYTKWFDYDIITKPLCLRTRRQGDYLILPDGGKQSLQDFFVNEKIPLGMRDSVPLAADGSHVLWIVGHRISAAAKITEKTKTIIEITYGGDYGKASSWGTDR